MYFHTGKDERPNQKGKAEAPSEIEKTLRKRLNSAWPSAVLEDKEAEHISSKVLFNIFNGHDKPHDTCRTERWYINGRLGKTRRYGISVSFFTTIVGDGFNLIESNSQKNRFSAVQFSIIDTQTQLYYRFSELDHSASTLLLAFLSEGIFDGADTYLTQAITEQLNADRLILPDQAMSGPTVLSKTELNITFGRCFLRVVSDHNETDTANRENIMYHLHLEGRSLEHGEGNLQEEVEAEVDLKFHPVMNPVLHGDHGVISHGRDWTSDLFSYSFPNLRIRSGSCRLTRASDKKEICRELDIRSGWLWMEHRFGGVLVENAEEALFRRSLVRHRRQVMSEYLIDQCSIRLFNVDQDCICVTRESDPTTGEVRRAYAVVQCGAKRQSHAWEDDVSLVATPNKQYRSSETGILYSTEWTVRTPTHDGAHASLQLSAIFPEQEFVTFLMQPSFWEGVVSLKGTITQMDGSTQAVEGEGFMSCYGHGRQQRLDEFFATLHSAGATSMKNPKVAQLGNWEAISEGPALDALSSLSIVASMHELHLSGSEKIVLQAVLGTYGYIFHHPSDRAAVCEALQWCHYKWLSFYGQATFNYQVLRIRAFMLHELGAVMWAKCASWIPKGAVALDMVALPASSVPCDEHKASGKNRPVPPSPEELCCLPSGPEISQLKALIDGRWAFTSSVGSLSAVLMEQGFGFLHRSLIDKLQPTLRINVDRDSSTISITILTILYKKEHVYRLNGELWSYESKTRGHVSLRTGILDGGRKLYIEMHFPKGGVERVWYDFANGGKKLVQTICYYRSADTVDEPVSRCTRYYTLELPHNGAKLH
ncbi:unnamed protein product [Phytomonas sp. EM1]|nr:unnamed protein product [Phytomonas sp. EM1]|eukprot:CCW62145.1 unnamed protein product [Phytomonas sp. isolate EM1]